jgi:hypothetical protein
MNDDIETLLSRMPLKKPPASLDARIRALHDRAAGTANAPQAGQRKVWILGIVGGSLAAAAAALLAWGLWPTTPTSAPEAMAKAPDAAGPIRVEQNWSQVSYDGLVFPDEQTPMQKFRRQTVEHVQWIDAKNGVRMETTRPKEDIMLLSAPLQ